VAKHTKAAPEINIEPICKQIKFREQRQDALLCSPTVALTSGQAGS
jgi:hypothetical protein